MLINLVHRACKVTVLNLPTRFLAASFRGYIKVPYAVSLGCVLNKTIITYPQNILLLYLLYDVTWTNNDFDDDNDKDPPLWHSWSSPGKCVAPWFLYTEPDTLPGSDWGHLIDWVDELYTATGETVMHTERDIFSTQSTLLHLLKTLNRSDRGKQRAMHWNQWLSRMQSSV